MCLESGYIDLYNIYLHRILSKAFNMAIIIDIAKINPRTDSPNIKALFGVSITLPLSVMSKILVISVVSKFCFSVDLSVKQNKKHFKTRYNG